MDKTIVLGSVSLRAARTIVTSTVTDDVLQSVSLRAARTIETSAVTADVMAHSSLPIAGFKHSGGQWEDPKDMSYVVVNV